MEKAKRTSCKAKRYKYVVFVYIRKAVHSTNTEFCVLISKGGFSPDIVDNLQPWGLLQVLYVPSNTHSYTHVAI